MSTMLMTTVNTALTNDGLKLKYDMIPCLIVAALWINENKKWTGAGKPVCLPEPVRVETGDCGGRENRHSRLTEAALAGQALFTGSVYLETT